MGLEPTTPCLQIRRHVADAMETSTAGVVLSFPDGRQVALPPSLMNVLRTSAKELAGGHVLAVLPSDSMLTPAETGELLGLSRPFVARLLDSGEIASERLPDSRHRRIRLADVMTFADAANGGARVDDVSPMP